MDGNHAPGSLHGNLHQKRARSQDQGVEPNAQNGSTGSAMSAAIAMDQRRPIFSESRPKKMPPQMAPILRAP